MTDEELRLFKLRRDFEKQGIKWNARASIESLMMVAQSLFDELKNSNERIEQLEKRLGGLKVQVEHTDKHALVFSGDWQAERHYYPGNLVRFKGATFTALRDVVPGKDAPDSLGSGWSQVT